MAIIRATLGAGAAKSLGELQAPGLKDPGIKGEMWISTAQCPAPGAEVREAVLRGIKEFGHGTEKFELPDIADVEGEWTGWRSGVDKKAPRPDLGSEREHYDSLMKEVTSPLTILYFHGGAYFLMDPISHRPVTSSLAKRTGGRCFSVRYRLAPQTAFPGQLVDALTSYLYLLAPPSGSFHEPVRAQDIVFAGDSAGGHLSFSLLLLLLSLKRAGVSSIRFHGKDVPIDLPAGVTGNSPWFDITRSLPSVTDNAKYDYLNPPTATGMPQREIPEDDIWPSKPPRAEIFCTASTLLHPICSPLNATPEQWKGAPPVFMCCGNEGLEDEIVVVARRLYQAGTSVEFVGYAGTPHCSSFIFPTSEAGKDCMTRWADFAQRSVNGNVQRQDEGRWTVARSSPLQWMSVKLESMGLPDEKVRQRVEEMTGYATQREEERLKAYERARL